MKWQHIVGFGLIAVASADLLLGQSSTPLPVVGDYLTPTLDAVLIAGGLAVWFFL
jgi:hypothetical protein